MRDRIAAAATGITSLARRRSEATRAGTFHERAEALAAPARALAQLQETYRLLCKHGVSPSLPAATLHSLRGQAWVVKGEFAANQESILGADPQRFNTFWKPLKGLPEEVESALKVAWRHWCDQTVPGGDEELLKTLEKFPAFRNPVHVIRQGQVEKRGLSMTLPGEDATFTTVKSLGERMRKAWELLHGAQVSAEVLDFLKKAVAKEATLADYTPTVMKWVEDNGLLRSFQITTVGGK